MVKLSTAYRTAIRTSTKMVTPTFFFATSMDAPKVSPTDSSGRAALTAGIQVKKKAAKSPGITRRMKPRVITRVESTYTAMRPATFLKLKKSIISSVPVSTCLLAALYQVLTAQISTRNIAINARTITAMSPPVSAASEPEPLLARASMDAPLPARTANISK